MSNTNRPAGLKPVKHLNGSPWNGQANVYYIPATDSTAVFVGDGVKSAGAADVTGKYPTVAQAAAGDALRGVVIGFGEVPQIMINPTNPDRVNRPADTAMYVLVVDDPNVIFEIQEDGVGGTIAAASVGLSTDLVVGAGNDVNGKSGMELDSSGVTASAATCKILRVVNREDNALGANCKWEVLVVEHEMNLATGV